MFQLPKTKLPLTPSPFPQQGFALIPLLVLLVIGIAAGTLLTQNGVNFLPKAADDEYVKQVKATLDQLPSNSSYLITLGNGGEIGTDNAIESQPAFSVIKLWIAAAALKQYGLDNKEINQLVTPMLINSDNTAANTLIDKLSFQTVNSYINENDYKKTYLGRYMLAKNTSLDNMTSAQNSIWFMQNLINNKVVSPEVSERIRSLLAQRNSSSDPFYVSPSDVNKTFIGKSGILDEGRNDVGTFLDKNGKRVYFAVFAPSGGDSLRLKMANIQQALYNASGASSGTAPAAAPAGQPTATGPTSGGCTQDQIDQCKKENPKTDRCYIGSAGKVCVYSKDLEGKKSCDNSCPNSNNEGCFIFRGEQKCLYPTGSTSCQNEANCTIIVRDGKTVSDHPQKCNVGWRNYCRLVFNKGCVDKTDGVPDCDGDPTPLSQGTTAGAPALTSSTANAQATGAAPRNGAPPQGAAAQTSSGKPGITTTKCSSSQISNTGCSATPDRCVVDYAGNGWCKYPAEQEGKACNSTHKGACGSADCRVINGLPRCQATTCTDKDNAACGSNSTCTPGSEQGFSYTYCGPKDGTSSSGDSKSPVRTDMTSADCGYTTGNPPVPIPCYKVGVFTSGDEIKATKDQASIATKRYLESQKILDEVKDSVNQQVQQAAAAAKKKLEIAKAKADACMKQ